MNAPVFQQRLSAMVLLVAMMLHVHGVPGAGLRIVLLLAALWHAIVSVHIVLGDYPLPLGLRRGVSGAATLGALLLAGLGSQAVLVAYAPVEPPPAATEPTAEGATDAPEPAAPAWAEVEPLIGRCGMCHPDTAGDVDLFRTWTTEAPVREQLAANHNLTPAEAAVVTAWLDAGMPGPTTPEAPPAGGPTPDP